MGVHNMMEDIVRACLKDLMQHQPNVKDLDEKKQDDVMAIALNHLPAKYVASSAGEVYTKTQLRTQVETDVYRELAGAIDKVQNSSRKSALSERLDT